MITVVELFALILSFMGSVMLVMPELFFKIFGCCFK